MEGPPPKLGSSNALANAGHTAVTRPNKTNRPSKGTHVFHDSGLFKSSSPTEASQTAPFARRLRSSKCEFLVRCFVERAHPYINRLYFAYHLTLSKAKLSCFASFVDFSTNQLSSNSSSRFFTLTVAGKRPSKKGFSRRGGGGRGTAVPFKQILPQREQRAMIQ